MQHHGKSISDEMAHRGVFQVQEAAVWAGRFTGNVLEIHPELESICRTGSRILYV